MPTVDSDLYAEAPVLRARIPVPAAAVDLLLDATAAEDPAPGAFQDLETGECNVEIFGVDRAAVERSVRAVFDACDTIGIEPGAREASVESLPAEDWAQSWKRFFKVVRVSRRVTIRPPWEPYEPADPREAVVTIEPGMSFGTGLHATTQGCLRFLEALAEEAEARGGEGGAGDGPAALSVADVGCGSGILSIAARKLGFRHVVGVDYDLAAVRISAENAAANGCGDIPYSVCDVTCDEIPRADIVVANILAPVLRAAAPRIAAAVNDTPRAALVLSGILATQWDNVRSAYEPLGFRQESLAADGEWVSGLMRRGAGSR